jgi:hypothetical protein
LWWVQNSWDIHIQHFLQSGESPRKLPKTNGRTIIHVMALPLLYSVQWGDFDQNVSGYWSSTYEERFICHVNYLWFTSKTSYSGAQRNFRNYCNGQLRKYTSFDGAIIILYSVLWDDFDQNFLAAVGVKITRRYLQCICHLNSAPNTSSSGQQRIGLWLAILLISLFVD